MAPRTPATRRVHRTVARLALGCLLACAPLAATPAWQLEWHDEFTGSLGTPINTTNWSFDFGNGENGWGNNELQYYTARRENARIETNCLVIEARREAFSSGGTTYPYTSARLKALARATTYGRFEARIKVPSGVGLWSAFWMLGANISQVSWPACGELDIMENLGKDPLRIFATAHGPGYSGTEGLVTHYALPSRQLFIFGFHDFAIEWEPNRVRWLVDQDVFFTVTPESLPPGAPWVFDHDFYALLNLAVGGPWAGDPSATTFPRQLIIDHVRAYSRIDAPDPTIQLRRETNRVVASWPSQYPHGILQKTTDLRGDWSDLTGVPSLSDDATEFQIEVDAGYYRLRLSPQ